MYYILSILLGLIPEVLYFTLFICFTKNIKEKRFRLFLLISIAYFICILLRMYRLIYYLLFVALVYLILKLLYRKKTQIIDIFVITFSFFHLSLMSYICFLFMNYDKSNYFLLYIADRILIFSIFIFKNKFNKIYKKYCSMWNRNDNIKKPIKSITLRNISLISMNFIIVFMNIYMILIV